MIKVYFESSAHAELVAIFADEDTYSASFPALELQAEASNMIVTESVDSEPMPDMKFPNGFTSWMETFYEMSSAITMELAKEPHIGLLVAKRYDEQGHGGMYELAEELTNEFEKLHAGRQWDGEFFDTIQQFIESKF